MTLIANSNTKHVIRAAFNDGKWEFPLWPINLPIEKYVFLMTNRCRFGNFANVPTTGCIKLKMRVAYDCMEGFETYYTQFMYTMTIYTYYTCILL